MRNVTGSGRADGSREVSEVDVSMLSSSALMMEQLWILCPRRTGVGFEAISAQMVPKF